MKTNKFNIGDIVDIKYQGVVFEKCKITGIHFFEFSKEIKYTLKGKKGDFDTYLNERYVSIHNKKRVIACKKTIFQKIFGV